MATVTRTATGLSTTSKTETIVQADERERRLREGMLEAIRLAMASQWEHAAEVNRALLEMAPQDAEASNRLGRALLELGELKGAEQAFRHSLSVAPGGGIARKNLERIIVMAHARDAGTGARPAAPQRIPVNAFIHDHTKAARVALTDAAAWTKRSHVSTGTRLCLRVDGPLLTVCEASSEGPGEARTLRVGTISPALGLRLAKLMRGGNRYEGAVCANTPDGVVLLLRETYQHPSQRGCVSFPSGPGPLGTAPLRRRPVAATGLVAADVAPAESLRWPAGGDDDESTADGLDAALEDAALGSPPFEADGEA